VVDLTRAGRLWRSFLNGLIQDVPEAYALCEFDCHRTQCSATEWARCERRLQRAAGEFMPQRDIGSRSASTQLSIRRVAKGGVVQ
jgi:hypothetical protein